MGDPQCLKSNCSIIRLALGDWSSAGELWLSKQSISTVFPLIMEISLENGDNSGFLSFAVSIIYSNGYPRKIPGATQNCVHRAILWRLWSFPSLLRPPYLACVGLFAAKRVVMSHRRLQVLHPTEFYGLPVPLLKYFSGILPTVLNFNLLPPSFPPSSSLFLSFFFLFKHFGHGLTLYYSDRNSLYRPGVVLTHAFLP